MFFCFQRLNVNKLTLYILRRKETCTSFSFCFLNTNWNIEEQNSVSRKEEKALYTNERINPCSVSNVRFGCHYVTFCIKTKLVFFRLSKLCALKMNLLCMWDHWNKFFVHEICIFLVEVFSAYLRPFISTVILIAQ